MTPAEVADLLDGQAADDEMAAAAYEIFGRSVFPFEGVFLDPDVTSRGPLSDALREDVLPGSLWMWVPAFCCALRDVGDSLGDGVATSLEAALVEVEPATLALRPGSPPDLDDLGTDLRSVIDYLATPARCGMFLSTSVLEEVGRAVGIPRGFGPRRRILRELLIGASRYEALDAVLASFAAVADRHGRALASSPYVGPGRDEALAPWRSRIAKTGALLAEMRRRTGELSFLKCRPDDEA